MDEHDIRNAGLDTGEDIGVIDGQTPMADSEYDDFMKNITDPKHPDNQLWMKGDPQDPKRIQLQARYDALNLKKYGTGEVSTAPAAGGNPGPGYAAAKESFREDLGMEAGPEFEASVQNFHAWANDTFSSPDDFHRLAVAAEKALGVKGAAALGVQLAQAHARSRR